MLVNCASAIASPSSSSLQVSNLNGYNMIYNDILEQYMGLTGNNADECKSILNSIVNNPVTEDEIALIEQLTNKTIDNDLYEILLSLQDNYSLYSTNKLKVDRFILAGLINLYHEDGLYDAILERNNIKATYVDPNIVTRSATPSFELSIVADPTPTAASGSIDRGGKHAWLIFKNISMSNITVCGRVIGPSQSITLGTYGNAAAHTGMWMNLEAHLANKDGTYSNRSSISQEFPSSKIASFNSLVRQYNDWTTLRNCAYAATAIWNGMYPTHSLIQAAVPTPTYVYNQIVSISGYVKGKPMPYLGWRGYLTSSGSIVLV